MQRRLDKLTEQADHMFKDFMELQTANERTNSTLMETRKSVDEGKQDTGGLDKKILMMADRVGDLSSSLEQNQLQLKETKRVVQAAEGDMRLLRKGLENLDNHTQVLQQSQSSNVQNVADLNLRMSKAAEDINHILGEQDNFRQSQLVGNDSLQKSCHRIDLLSQGLQEITAESRDQGHAIEALQQRDVEHTALTDGSLAKITDLMKSHRKAASCITSLTHELEKTREEMRATGDRLDQTSMGLHNTRADLSKTNTTIAKLSGSVEECHGAFQGLRGGFEDMHRHVTTEGAMLPSKTNGMPPLPSLVSQMKSGPPRDGTEEFKNLFQQLGDPGRSERGEIRAHDPSLYPRGDRRSVVTGRHFASTPPSSRDKEIRASPTGSTPHSPRSVR